MGGAKASALGVPALLALALLLPARAEAAAPLKISELFPGSAAAGAGAELVELQMTADGQEAVAGGVLSFYGASGSATPTSTFTLPAAVANGASQRTVLIASSEAVSEGISPAPDFDLGSGADRIDPAGGAVCLTGAAPPDCLTWGSIPPFGPLSGFPDPQGQNAAPGGIADGLSLQRSLAAGCPTYLDGPDDSNDGAADFIEAAPSPRPNATPPSETRCAPDTSIQGSPPNPSASAAASFSFAALPSEPGVSFQCELDGDGSFAAASACDSGSIAYSSLGEGSHTFRVRAVGEGGPDPTPAQRTWTVDTTAPQTTIASAPPEPSSGFEAHFAYASSEPSSSFRCQLDEGAVENCGTSATSGSKSYFDLRDGTHAFRVWATDNAGNQDQTPATHSFAVDTAIDDRTPPDTSILLAPPDPSPSDSAFFAYASSESPATFQCSLDGAPFASCSAQGASYADLPNGTHDFAVRAADRAGNLDSVPATRSWRVAAPVPDTRIVKAPPARVRSRRGAPVRVAFRFAADKPGSSFRCRLDLSGPYRRCASPHSFEAAPGRHVFEVFAVDRLGNEEGTPAFRVFTVAGPGAEPAFFARSGRLISSLSATISPRALPRRRPAPVALGFASTFENLDGTDIPSLSAMTVRLARGGELHTRGLARCTRARLIQRTSAAALAACGAALVGTGTVTTALRFPEGRRSRSAARLLLFNAPGGILMHVYATEPLEGTFVVALRVSRRRGAVVLSARFPRIAAGYGHLTGFRMKIARSYRWRGRRRSYLSAACAAPPGLNRVAFELAKVTYRFRGGPRIANSTFNVCRAKG